MSKSEMIHGPWLEYGDIIINLAQYERVKLEGPVIKLVRPDSTEKNVVFESGGAASVAMRAITAATTPLYLGEPDFDMGGKG